MRLLGIDPGLTATGWCCLDKLDHVGSGTVHHGLRGRGDWVQKIDRILPQVLDIAKALSPDLILIEKPHYGTRGGHRGIASMVALMATMDLAWTLAFHLRPSYDVSVLTPDRTKKTVRALHLPGILHDLPTRTNEHVRDAAWLVLRGMRLV